MPKKTASCAPVTERNQDGSERQDLADFDAHVEAHDIGDEAVFRERKVLELGGQAKPVEEAEDQHGDPRAHALLEALARAGAAEKLTREIPERIAEATGEFVNIDYALAVLVHTLGLPPGNELVLFAMARTVGWIAHASEQLRHGGLIRPRARYIGPAPGRSAALSRP